MVSRHNKDNETTKVWESFMILRVERKRGIFDRSVPQPLHFSTTKKVHLTKLLV
jgi:hypothetical protein